MLLSNFFVNDHSSLLFTKIFYGLSKYKSVESRGALFEEGEQKSFSVESFLILLHPKLSAVAPAWNPKNP
jgi:hypothetical protein